MTEEEYSQAMMEMMKDYCTIVQKNLDERWKKLPLKLSESAVYEVIGGLMARQATLTIQLAENPSIWNGHIAPLILRSMTDAHITLAWILTDNFEERAKKYILYGLGQEKKLIEHLKNEAHGSVDMTEMIELKEKWLESQRYPFLTEVNLGSWSGSNTRQMAQDADCETLYKFAYEPFSANMWQHISLYNLKECQNPLHKFHRVPIVLEVPINEDFVYRSSKYISRAYQAVDQKFNLDIKEQLPEDWYIDNINKLEKEFLNEKELKS
jgi:hypothetical protein